MTPASHAEPTQRALSGVAEGVVVRPGDTLVLRARSEHAETIRQWIKDAQHGPLKGVRVLVVDVEGIGVVRGDH